MRARVMMTRPRLLLGLVLFLPFVLATCSAPVTVERVDPRTVHRELTGNVLTVGEESSASRIVLDRWDLTERFESDPEGTLAQLHGVVTDGRAGRDELFALAELSFLHAEQTGKARVLPGSRCLCLCSALSARCRGAALPCRSAAKGGCRSVQSRPDLCVRFGGPLGCRAARRNACASLWRANSGAGSEVAPLG